MVKSGADPEQTQHQALKCVHAALAHITDTANFNRAPINVDNLAGLLP